MKNNKSFVEILRSMKTEWKWIFSHASAYKPVIALYIFLGIAGVGLSLSASVISKYVIDAVINKNTDNLILKCALVVLFAVAQMGFTAITSWISAKTSTKVNNELRNECYSDVLLADWQQIGKYHSGELVNRLEGDVNQVSSVIIGFIPGLITKLTQFIAAFFILFYYDKIMAVLSLLSAPILVISSRTMVKTIRKFSKKSRELNGEILSFTEESVQNLQLIKAFNIKKKYIKDFGELLYNYREVKLNYEKFSILMTLLFSATGLVINYLCYGWAIYRLWGSVITVGTLTLFIQLSSYLSGSFSSLAGMVPSTITIATAAGRLMEICGIKKEKEAGVGDKFNKSSDSITITFNNLSFSYNEDNRVIDNLNGIFSLNDSVSVIGHSGAGKTTLLRLMLGLIHPVNGEIQISDGTHSFSADETTRELFTYVPQEACLFSGTIADNLRLGNENVSDEEINNMLDTVCLTELINSLPDGINTVLGERGANLSSGQAQRVSLARALLRDTPFILLDEATSALDRQTEAKILGNIGLYCKDKILFFTTHKQDVMDFCNKTIEIN